MGRSSRRAFAYLTYRRGKVLTDIAAKRLSAVREFAEFGAGFKRFTQCIMPVYPLTAGISNNLLAGAVRRVLEDCVQQLEDPLPESLRAEHQLAHTGYAVRTVHFPPSWEELEVARRRLVFEELFFLSLGLALLKGRSGRGLGTECRYYDPAEYYATLPFTLTGAQRRTVEEAFADLPDVLVRPLEQVFHV